MKTLFVYIIVLLCCPAVFGQSQLAVMKIDSSAESKAYWNKWFDNLYEMGVETKNDSLFVREEVVKLFTDAEYRSTAYPEQYNWSGAIYLLKQMELKKAFWHMINLYESDSAHRALVVGTFVAYDSLMNMDKILLSTYYTYAFADPRISRIVNDRPDIFRPDLLEQGLARLKEIIGYVWFYREKRMGK